MVGFIKDYRKELESDIWLMPPLYHRTWQYLKYKVNHDEAEIPMRDGTKFKIMPGQHLTSIRNIAKEIGWYEGRAWKEPNPKTIKTILDWLEKVRMIEIDTGTGNRQYTLITLINWASYQTKDDRGNSKVTVGKQSADINKNVKNESLKNLYGAHVLLTDAQHKKLVVDLSEPIVSRLIADINYWFTQKPSRIKDYSDHNLMIRKWSKRKPDKPESRNNTSSLPIHTPSETERNAIERALAEQRAKRNGARGITWDSNSAS